MDAKRLFELRGDLELGSAKVWLQSDKDEEGANLIPVVDVKVLGDKISTPGANEGDLVVRFHE